MCAAMAPSGGRAPYAANNASLNEAAAYAYELEGGANGAAGGGPGGGGRNSVYDSRGLAAAGYDVRSKHGPPMATPQGYYPNEEEAHFGPPGTGNYGDYGDGGYYQPQKPPRGMGGPGGGPGGGWYAQGGPHHHNSGGYIEDEYVTAFSDEEADDMDSRMSRVQVGHGAYGTHDRAKSLLRYNELERERSRRRQTIVKQKTSSKLFPGKLKLSMMNTGLIPLKKGMN